MQYSILKKSSSSCMKNLLFNNYCSHISRLAGYIYIYIFIELGLMSDQVNVSIVNQTKKIVGHTSQSVT